MSLRVDGDRAYRAESLQLVARRRRAAQHALELLLARRGDEPLVRYPLEAALARELLGALAGEHHMRRVLHHAPCEVDGVAHRGHTGDGARREVLAAHDGGVEIGAAVMSQHRAASGVEERVVLEDAYRRGDRIEAAAALLEHRIAGIQGFLQACVVDRAAIGSELLARDDAGTAVDGDGEAPRFRRRRRGVGGLRRGRGQRHRSCSRSRDRSQPSRCPSACHVRPPCPVSVIHNL